MRAGRPRARRGRIRGGRTAGQDRITHVEAADARPSCSADPPSPPTSPAQRAITTYNSSLAAPRRERWYRPAPPQSLAPL
eukprot:6529393-Prymnesium_polylepis.1